jgi:Zn-dependent membrane protease YugP
MICPSSFVHRPSCRKEKTYACNRNTRPVRGIAGRGFLLPALQVSPTISYICILLGLWWNLNGMLWIGILFFGLMVLFSILTLPVELNASRRGTTLLQEAGLMQNETDASGSRAVLTAAALTYLAAAITSILQLLYYISVAERRS